MGESEPAQPLRAPALEEPQVGGVIDAAGEVGVFIVDAHQQFAGRGMRQGHDSCDRGMKRRFRAFPSTDIPLTVPIAPSPHLYWVAPMRDGANLCASRKRDIPCDNQKAVVQWSTSVGSGIDVRASEGAPLR